MADYANLSPAGDAPSGGSYSIDDKYTVTLTASGDGGDNMSFETSVDETLAISLSSQWAAPFENLLSDTAQSIVNKAGQSNPAMGAKLGRYTAGASILGKGMGVQVRPKAFTAQVWQSSSSISFSIPFTFVAINDPVKDVYSKVKNLLKLCAPSELGAGLISAPGPVMVDVGDSTGRDITLQIGEYLTLKQCIIKNVQAQFDNVIGEAGIPLRAKVNVEIESWYAMFTTQDIDNLFVKGG